MTLEDLSVATAERYESRMMHDVKNTSQTRAPPRPDPPLFGRESMEDAVSARVAENRHDGEDESPKQSDAKASARAVTIEDEVDAFFTLFQRIESRLHLHLTEDDKKRIRDSLSVPSDPILKRITSDPATTTLIVSVLLTFVVIYVCNGNSRRVYARGPYRGESRSELMTWNIGRLLKPLNRPR